MLKLTYDEAALFNFYNASSKRKLIDAILRGINYADEDAKELALSLRYKINDLSSGEYSDLYRQIPLPCGF